MLSAHFREDPAMIIDTLAHASAYRQFSLSITEALHFLKHTHLEALPDGRIEMEGPQEYAMVQTYATCPAAEKRWEAHRSYIDLQYMLEGTEWLGYAPLEELEVIEPYDQARDVEWLRGEGSFIKLPAGSFAILGPQDAHKPGLTLAESSTVRKIVFKLQAHAWKRGE
jgi:YhcH/YjgK/YiaL family protein